MTKDLTNKPSLQNIASQSIKKIIAIISLIAMLMITLLYSDEISHSVRSGLSLCASVIIPSVFPFIIISELLVFVVDFGSLKRAGLLFEKFFKINRAGLCAFILGLLCGFPLGVKSATELYKAGLISKDEAERLIGFSNNTGPAFLISGIGIGLRGSITDGLILYISMIIAAVAVGIIFSKNAPQTIYDNNNPPFSVRDFSLTKSIRSAGLNTLYICSYLTFFACFCGILRKLIGECIPYLLIIPFLEVGSSTSILSKTKLLSECLSLTLSSFAISFSGISVHLQAMSFINETDLHTKRYFIMKLMQGFISATLTYLIYTLIYLFGLF